MVVTLNYLDTPLVPYNNKAKFAMIRALLIALITPEVVHVSARLPNTRVFSK